MINASYTYENQILKKYDDLMVEIGNHLLEAEYLLSFFIKNIIIANNNRLDIDMDLDEQRDPVYKITIKCIIWDEDKGRLEISAIEEGNECTIDWNTLPIETKNLIVNYIHISLLSDDISKSLN